MRYNLTRRDAASHIYFLFMLYKNARRIQLFFFFYEKKKILKYFNYKKKLRSQSSRSFHRYIYLDLNFRYFNQGIMQ